MSTPVPAIRKTKGAGNKSTLKLRMKIYRKTGLNAREYAKKHGFHAGGFYKFLQEYGKTNFEGVKRITMQEKLIEDGIIETK